MFFDKLTEDDFLSSLEKNMTKQHSFNNDLEAERRNKLTSYLGVAAQSLNNAGLKKEAQMVLQIKDVCGDPATKGLTPEKQVENLKSKGWQFNADDHNADTCDADDCGLCEDGDQPQLSQEELKKLRALLGKK
jgi:hypothetical protein